jgi:hypothetical protein
MRRLTLALAGAVILLVSLAPVAGAADLDCKDFPSQAAAQANLNANPSDPNHLDADHDGKACEAFPYRISAGAGASAGSQAPQLPFTGPSNRLPVIGGVLLLLGAAAVVGFRHRPQH